MQTPLGIVKVALFNESRSEADYTISSRTPPVYELNDRLAFRSWLQTHLRRR
jgi:hypothetical protein